MCPRGPSFPPSAPFRADGVPGSSSAFARSDEALRTSLAFFGCPTVFVGLSEGRRHLFWHRRAPRRRLLGSSGAEASPTADWFCPRGLSPRGIFYLAGSRPRGSVASSSRPFWPRGVYFSSSRALRPRGIASRGLLGSADCHVPPAVPGGRTSSRGRTRRSPCGPLALPAAKVSLFRWPCCGHSRSAGRDLIGVFFLRAGSSLDSSFCFVFFFPCLALLLARLAFASGAQPLLLGTSAVSDDASSPPGLVATRACKTCDLN